MSYCQHFHWGWYQQNLCSNWFDLQYHSTLLGNLNLSENQARMSVTILPCYFTNTYHAFNESLDFIHSIIHYQFNQCKYKQIECSSLDLILLVFSDYQFAHHSTANLLEVAIWRFDRPRSGGCQYLVII